LPVAFGVPWPPELAIDLEKVARVARTSGPVCILLLRWYPCLDTDAGPPPQIKLPSLSSFLSRVFELIAPPVEVLKIKALGNWVSASLRPLCASAPPHW